MRAVTFDVTPSSYVLGKALGSITESVLWGRASGVKLTDVTEAPLPGERWVRIEVLKAGICGTDIGNLTLKASPAMEPFGSFPAVLGHEIVGRVVEVGPAVRRVEVGQRVVVDPMISCTVRGWAEPCRACADGLHATCERAGEEGPLEIGGRRIRPGTMVGYHADLPGGWGERTIMHEAHVFPVDDAIDDRTAVLVEPLAIAMHAVLRSRPWGEGPALVVGSGPIALATIWALRAAGYRGELVAQIKRGHEGDLARALGADEVVTPGEEAREALVRTGAQAYMPLLGDEVYAGGGFPLVFDCVGSAESLTQCLRYVAARGRIVLLGNAPKLPKLDLTFLWAREVTVHGSVGYGREAWGDGHAHTFEVTHDLILESGAPLSGLVTHVYPLAQYRDALSTARGRRRTGSIKVLLEPRAG
ncbi:MAG TPA: alcohol dehydrogenase catalytic domain-containing protein [Longimicrobiales bacterium]|nr:alcohol dehydrogenase catalytic domain-containing protein [Longimicrobiales bacterium]